MPRLIESPTIIEAAGNKPKEIAEYIGRVNSQTQALSIAKMKSPQGWVEPGQQPEFSEYTVVLQGELHVKDGQGHTQIVTAGQAIIAEAGEWVQYSSPTGDGAEYLAVCLPAFSVDAVHRDMTA